MTGVIRCWTISQTFGGVAAQQFASAMAEGQVAGRSLTVGKTVFKQLQTLL